MNEKLLIRMHEVTVPQSQQTQADSFISTDTHCARPVLNLSRGQK